VSSKTSFLTFTNAEGESPAELDLTLASTSALVEDAVLSEATTSDTILESTAHLLHFDFGEWDSLSEMLTDDAFRLVEVLGCLLGKFLVSGWKMTSHRIAPKVWGNVPLFDLTQNLTEFREYHREQLSISIGTLW
jgi:hypothetical protein